MRRPRGPGGRFLTADEVAALKTAAQDEKDPEDDGTGEIVKGLGESGDDSAHESPIAQAEE